MADLSALRELRAWMRDENIVHARSGELELRLGSPVPPSCVANASSQPEVPAEASTSVHAPAPPSPDDDERDALETLLHSSGADVDAFLRVRRKVPA